MNNDTRVLEVKATERDEEPDPRELEAELVRRGVLSEPHAAQYGQAVTNILGTENGDILGTENGDHFSEKAYAHVREGGAITCSPARTRRAQARAEGGRADPGRDLRGLAGERARW
jgi:hypothetical protein